MQLRNVSLYLIAVASLFACSSSSKNDGPGAGGGGQAAAGGSGAVAGAAGAGGGSGGGRVSGCASLCALAPTTSSTEDTCVSDFVTALGYPTSSTPQCVPLANEKNVANCNTCYAALGVDDDECLDAYDVCLEPVGSGGAGSGGEGAGGASTGGTGSGGTASGGSAGAATGGTGGTGSGGTGTGGTGSGGTGGTGTGGSSGLTTCKDLCALASSSTPAQDTCVASIITGKGYPTESTPSCQLLVVNKTPSQCNACYADVSVKDSDCDQAYKVCF